MLPGLEHLLSVAPKIRPLIDQASAALNDRREENRYPFLQPVRVKVKGVEDMTLHCFTRDISNSGVGLLCNFQLPHQEVFVTFAGEEELTVPGKVVWTQHLEREWYTCGMEFIKE